MVNKWITFPELCRRWDVSEYNLAEIILAGKITGYDKDFSELLIGDNVSVFKYPDGSYSGANYTTVTVDDLKGLAFCISDIEVFEKREFPTKPIKPNRRYIEECVKKIVSSLRQERSPIDRQTIKNRLLRDYLQRSKIPFPSISTLNRIFKYLQIAPNKPGRKPKAK